MIKQLNVEKINRLVRQYNSLTPFGLALMGMQFVESLNRELDGADDDIKATVLSWLW